MPTIYNDSTATNRDTKLQLHNYTITQLYTYTTIQLHNYTPTKLYTYTTKHLHNHTPTQLYAYTTTQYWKQNKLMKRHQK